MSIWGAGITAVGAIGSAYLSSRSAKKGAEANQRAISEANSTMAAAQVQAAQLLANGQVAAAQAAIEGAKIAAQAVMEAAQLSVAAQERFFAIADDKLEPFRAQGLIAGDELASMLGIPNSKGQLVPYDTEKLRQTPGYEFMFTQGLKATERKAAGTKLSGAQGKALTQYGQNYADQYFGRQIGYLQDMYGTGANAAGSLAQAAMGAGAGIGGAYTNQGQQLANIYGTQGTTLANIALGGAQSQADLATSLANAQGNLALTAGANRASLYQNQGNAWGGAIQGIAGALGGYMGSRGTTPYSSGGNGYGFQQEWDNF